LAIKCHSISGEETCGCVRCGTNRRLRKWCYSNIDYIASDYIAYGKWIQN